MINCHTPFLGTGKGKASLGSGQTFLLLIFLIPGSLIQGCKGSSDMKRLHGSVLSSNCRFWQSVPLFSQITLTSDFIFLHLSNFLTSFCINLIFLYLVFSLWLILFNSTEFFLLLLPQTNLSSL